MLLQQNIREIHCHTVNRIPDRYETKTSFFVWSIIVHVTPIIYVEVDRKFLDVNWPIREVLV